VFVCARARALCVWGCVRVCACVCVCVRVCVCVCVCVHTFMLRTHTYILHWGKTTCSEHLQKKNHGQKGGRKKRGQSLVTTTKGLRGSKDTHRHTDPPPHRQPPHRETERLRDTIRVPVHKHIPPWRCTFWQNHVFAHEHSSRTAPGVCARVVCVCACAWACVCARVCVCASVEGCAYVRVRVRARACGNVRASLWAVQKDQQSKKPRRAASA